jgi:hypothetical protein
MIREFGFRARLLGFLGLRYGLNVSDDEHDKVGLTMIIS